MTGVKVFDVTTYPPVHGSGNTDIIIGDVILYIAVSSLSFVGNVLSFCTGFYRCMYLLLFANSNQTCTIKPVIFTALVIFWCLDLLNYFGVLNFGIFSLTDTDTNNKILLIIFMAHYFCDSAKVMKFSN